MAIDPGAVLAGLRSDLAVVVAAVRDEVAGLGPTGLAWKPAPTAWSIAECLDHLVVTDTTYDVTFDQVLADEHRRRLWHLVPLLPRWWAGLLLSAVDPANARRVSVPRVYAPTASPSDPTVVERYLARGALLDRYLAAFSARPGLLATVITSPAAAVMVYSLGDTLTILVRHHQRHLAQCRRVKATPGFPTA